jgi:ribosomal protein L7Ae-like RNA K-turn-binding protein
MTEKEQKFLKEKLKQLLTLAYRIGKVKLGLEETKIYTNKRFKGFIIYPTDITPRVRKEINFLRKKSYKCFEIPFTKAELGNIFGKNGAVSILFLPNTQFTFKIEKLLRKLSENKNSEQEGSNLGGKNKRIYRKTRRRLQSNKRNFKRTIWNKDKSQSKTYGGPQTNNRFNNSSFKNTTNSRGRSKGITSKRNLSRGKRTRNANRNQRGKNSTNS